MCPMSYYQNMRNCKDKRAHRYQMIQYALKHGIKPAARLFHTSSPVVRKWLTRFKEHGYDGLLDLSYRPKHSPRATTQSIKNHIVSLKKKYRRLGAAQVKILEKLSQAPKTIRKIWKEANVALHRRKKKYITKQNLREVKKKFYLFQQCCEDTKDLIDIPEYWPQMKRLNLPKVQYTRREVSCGILFTGYANERSLIHATLFAAYINHHMKKYNALPEDSARLQTDNGSEFIGSWNAKEPSAYTKMVESLPGQEHTTIFPGAHRMQADVETVHSLMETEFYEIEQFSNRADFIARANTYQLFFNLKRPNTYKEHKTPWQLALEKKPDLDKRLLMTAAVDLDELLKAYLASLAQGGKNVLTDP
ncbi:MAG: helix-turn-helix domain containing protein, partial [Candidatus Omnitrophica bacterium]|nr:helix-turn-helix domain containing protein [Candidatus Omnitrophota bacterium]